MGQVVWLKSAHKQEMADLKRCVNTVIRREMEENIQGKIYRAFVTRTRLQGYCRLLIFDASCRDGAEYYGLHFDAQGVCDYQYFPDADREEIQQFLRQEEYEEIHYRQAIALLRDAVMQNYKYDTHLELVGEIDSTHLLRASVYQMTDQNPTEPRFYLQGVQEQMLIRGYLLAVTRDDAALVYDMYDAATQEKEGSRGLYCYNWNHELQGCRIIRMIDLPKTEEDDVWKIHMLFRSASDKPLETIVYFHLLQEDNSWRIGDIHMAPPWELREDSPVNPVQDHVFVSVIEENVNEIVAVLRTQNNVEETLNGDGYPKLYKWLKTNQTGIAHEDVSAFYTVQIMVLEKQVILYSNQLYEVNQAIEFLLSMIKQPLLFSARGVDTLENIYYTTVIKKCNYREVSGQNSHFSFSGEMGQRILGYCLSRFAAKWQYYASGSCSFCDKVDNCWVEIHSCRNELLVHFYNITADEALQQEAWSAYHQLAEISLKHGKIVHTVVRTRNLYYPYVDVLQEFLKKNILEYGHGNRKIKFM